ncbi:iron complex outermembrane receptor protein [Balneicella halophila]|uniref:Iron complex outermembrane receptor protein n=1 Tax=Balneicella halophila TaxID=1537566 RepID=A0A7L4UPT6_BALHA|nr:TonB-dependent receptor [Balneicella halophila]PVX51770.1 iron complex outermembrane receptor protein [Balneicella halophila]
MKQNLLIKVFLFLWCIVAIPATVFAQKTITGKVYDDMGTLPGASVLVKGTANGTTTDIDGNFTLQVNDGDIIEVSYVGFATRELIVGQADFSRIVLSADTEVLDEVVVIGYGTTTKKDATGSVTSVKIDEDTKIVTASPEQMLSGKTPGVQITASGGAPGDGGRIRIRGGSSLSASNDPLIVIDGVPVDNDGINGMGNALSSINPNDIESFTVLKDASAAAIYGSRASNGVIIITTKSGKGDLKVNYNGSVSFHLPSEYVDVLSPEEFKQVMQTKHGDYTFLYEPKSTDSQYMKDYINYQGTDWQKEIFNPSVGHEHNVSLSGSIKQRLPFRVSLGYLDDNGILRTSQFERTTAAVSLRPNFFDNHLKVKLNVKGVYAENRFADTGSIGAAVGFDPTKPIMNGSKYGGYTTWVQQNGNPQTLPSANPIALLELTNDESTVKRSLGNAEFDYKFHFLPDLRANLNLGYDYSESEGQKYVPEYASWQYFAGGQDRNYEQRKRNTLLDFYLNYVKDIEDIDSRIDAMVGYSYQKFWRTENSLDESIVIPIGESNKRSIFDDFTTENVLLSYFGRLNYSLKDKYLLTFTLRRDGSSRFSEDNRWGLFPSAAFAWNIIDEGFLSSKEEKALSNLKLRLGYGVTGQQNINNGDYPYLAKYTIGQPTASYPLGGKYYLTYRPDGYDANIKWEETTTYNVGLDFGFLDERITGSIDAYLRETSDLLNVVPVPAGSNLTNQILTNVGTLENRGVEFSIATDIIQNDDFNWNSAFNITYNENEITKLTVNDDPNFVGVYTGGISGGTGNTIQIHAIGKPASSFYVYEQVYDKNERPIEGMYVDRNKDGKITEDDKYIYEAPDADIFMGWNNTLSYKNWDLSLSMRANLNNYVYNNVNSDRGNYESVRTKETYLNNATTDVLHTGFNHPQYFSDYYVENASFLKLDNITLGYRVNELWSPKSSMRLFASVKNVFTWTDYSGLDPEIAGGIDNNIYPRPLTVTFGVNVDF